MTHRAGYRRNRSGCHPYFHFQILDLPTHILNSCSAKTAHFTSSSPTQNPHHPSLSKSSQFSLSLVPSKMQFPFQNSDPQQPNPIASFIQNLKTQATQFLNSTLKPQTQQAPWAHISAPPRAGAHRFDLAMSTPEIEERLAGIPVYALSNAAEEFVLVSGKRTGKSLGLFCFKKEDAEALLGQMRSMNKDIREGARVVPVALNKIFQLKVDGVAFRLIPDSHQVSNAIKEKEKNGDNVEDFPGVPVFQSKSLVLMSQNKRYRPAFFRKEDLEDSLYRASRQQNQLNPAFRRGDIQVSVLEEIINGMKGSSASQWDDVVFIPPGFNVAIGEEGPVATA